MEKVWFYLFGELSETNYNLLVSYAFAIGILLYILGGLVWMLRDLFSEGDVISLRQRVPRAGKNDWIAWTWKSLFALFIVAGFVVCIYHFVHGHVAVALLLPVPFFLLARVVSSPKSHIQKRPSTRIEIVTLVLLVSAAAVMRCYDIADYPPGLEGDEVKMGIKVNDLLKGVSLLVQPGGIPIIPSAPLVLLQKFLPRCRAAIRSYAILCGILCIPAFYCLARSCLPGTFARLATVLLIFSPYHNLYSRVPAGARITIIEIIAIYFFITAINRRSLSRVALAAAGIAILQYGYCGQVMLIVLPLALFMAWIGRRIKTSRMVLLFTISIVVMSMLLVPLYNTYKRSPKSPRFNLIENYLMSFDDIKVGVRNTFLMFRDQKFGINIFSTQANSICLPLPLLTLLFGGLLLSFTIFGIWPEYLFGLCFLLFLLPSCLTSVLGNSHRTIMIIPPMYLLIGYALWTIAGIVRVFAGRIVLYVGLGILIVGCSVWGVEYFFKEMWEDPQPANLFETLWRTSEIRTTEAAWDLHKEGYKTFSSRPSDPYFWIYLSNNPRRSAWSIYDETTFRPKHWLPENWDDSKRAVVLSQYLDGPIFNIMTQWAWPYNWEEKFYPVGGARLLIGKTGELNSYKRQMLAPKPILFSDNEKKFKQWDGSLMFSEPYEVTFKDHTDGAEIYIDGEPWLSIGQKALFASGLHDVRILSPFVEERETYSREPYFDFKIEDPVTKNIRKVRVTPSMLYSIPVCGWVRTVHPVGDPSKLMYYSIEPFVYYNYVREEKRSREGVEVVHEWKSQVHLESGDLLSIAIYWKLPLPRWRDEVEVYVDGKAMPRHRFQRSITFQLEGSEKEQTVRIRWKRPTGFILLHLLQSRGECPPYEVFYPPANERFRYEEAKKEAPAPKAAPEKEIKGKKRAPLPRRKKRARKAEAGSYQVVEGFNDIVSYAHTRETYPDVRGGAEGWWEYHREEKEEVTWETAVCPEKKATVFVFWGQTGNPAGRAELLVDGKRALVFDTGPLWNGPWEGDGFKLLRRSLGYQDGNCGLYFLKVPKDYITTGKPCRITVYHIEGSAVAWFMIKNYKDTIEQKGVSEAQLQSVLSSGE